MRRLPRTLLLAGIAAALAYLAPRLIGPDIQRLDLITAILLLAFVLWYIPVLQAGCVITSDPKESFDVENESRKTLAQILGGIVLLFGLYSTSQTLLVSHKMLSLTEQGQVTERFTKAVGQLGDRQAAIRLGGIYALERIARDSTRDHGAIMAILAAYVRENRPKRDSCPAEPTSVDIQAILNVLGRRKLTQKDLSSEIDLSNTCLNSSSLFNADLQNANLFNTDLSKSDLRGINAPRITLTGATLSYVVMEGAHLESADLTGTNLTGAKLSRSKLTGAILSRSDLRGATVDGADMTSIVLEDAHVEGVDFRNVIGIRKETLRDSHTSPDTQFPHPR